ncbi:hypothetical protein Golax_011642 [Gossypium laxum]|uniref:Uncharacterized protein n=1 Tax=Gossypium laxum TaxID=34288 RepID=A0A7J8ZL32_9ROSI|nr:hypothetical protein [Gossypium laxum]
MLNQNTQQALTLLEKEVIQSNLLLRLPCYNFTLITSFAFGIPLLVVKESKLCLSPSVADPPLRPAIDHHLGKLLPHQLANQTRTPPQADSSFCSSAYRVLAIVSSCCSLSKCRFLCVTHPSTTGNTTSCLTCMC